MDTLILAQDDTEINDALKETPVQVPSGTLAVERLHFYPGGTPAAFAALGDAAASLGVSNSDRVKQKVIQFARKLLQKERQKPPAQQRDVVEFQIVFIFHQTSKEVAKDITKALWSIPRDPVWIGLPDQWIRALRVVKIWLMSCESGADRVASDPRLLPYIEQSLQMRVAAGMLITEKKPPPLNPREFWRPRVYTFTTGDVVHGALSLTPNSATFRTTPNWEIDAQGKIAPIPGTDPNQQSPVAGTVHIYDGLDHVDQFQVPSGTGLNILSPTAP